MTNGSEQSFGSPFSPTHTVHAAGVDTWPTADASQPNGPRLNGGLQVEVVQTWGDWTQVRCSNDWTAWVDGRWLSPIAPAYPTSPAYPSSPPTAAYPTTNPASAPYPPSAYGAASYPTPAGGGWTDYGSYDQPSASRGVTLDAATFQRLALPLAGAALVLVSVVLPWVRAGLGISFNAFDVPLPVLFGATDFDKNALSVGLVLLLVALAGAGVAVALPSETGRRIAGGLAAFIALLFLFQLSRSINNDNSGDASLGDIVGFGVFIALIGGGLLAGAPARQPKAAPDQTGWY